MEEKSNLYIVAIVGIIAVVAMVVLVMNVGARQSTVNLPNTVTDGIAASSEKTDATGQVFAIVECNYMNAAGADYTLYYKASKCPEIVHTGAGVLALTSGYRADQVQ